MTSVRSSPAAAAVVAGLVTGAVVYRSGPLVGLLGVTVLGFMVLMALVRWLVRWPSDPGAQNTLMRWTAAAFGIHLMLGLIIINSSALVNYLGGDALTYHAQAISIVGHWVHGSPLPHLPAGKDGFYYLLAGLYWVFGPTKLGGVALNAVLAAALVPVVCDTTHRLFGAAAARCAPMVVVFVPGMLIWPSQLLKEAPVLLLLAVAANCAVRVCQRVSLGPLLVLAVALAALLTFRGQVGFGVVVGLVIGIVLSRQHLVGGVAAGLMATAIIGAVVASGIGSSGYNVSVNSDLKQAQSYRSASATTANSGFATDTDISSTSRAISFLPQGMLTTGVGPFPWQLHGARELVAVPDVFAWWLLLLALWRTWKLSRRQSTVRPMLVLIVPALVTLALLALVIGNFGTVARERMQVLVLIAPIVAMGIAAWRVERQHQSMELVSAR